MAHNRRIFIQNIAAGAIGAISGGALLQSCDFSHKLKNIGFISGIVNNYLKDNWKETLVKAASFGFTEIESGWNYAKSPNEFKTFCNSIGIKPFAGGTSIAPLIENTQKYIDDALEIGYNYLVCYWPWIEDADNITVEHCKKAGDELNQIGIKCKEAGIKFCWHNHDKEFLKDTGEGLPFDLLMRYTDSELVFVELDVYWIKKGGANVIDYLNKYSGRYKILHVKDMDNSPERSFACPGDGIIDFPSIFSVSEDIGVNHYIVEKDGETNGIECLKRSAEYLKSLSI